MVRTVVISRGREPYGEGASDECRGRDTGPNAGPKTSGRRYVRWRDLTLNGNFPVAFEGGVASSSIRGGFAEKITSSVVRQRSNGALSERRRNGNRMGYDRLRLTPGARWICLHGGIGEGRCPRWRVLTRISIGGRGYGCMAVLGSPIIHLTRRRKRQTRSYAPEANGGTVKA